MKIKASLGMFTRHPSGRRDIIGSMDRKDEGVYVEYVQGLTDEFVNIRNWAHFISCEIRINGILLDLNYKQ